MKRGHRPPSSHRQPSEFCLYHRCTYIIMTVSTRSRDRQNEFSSKSSGQKSVHFAIENQTREYYRDEWLPKGPRIHLTRFRTKEIQRNRRPSCLSTHVTGPRDTPPPLSAFSSYVRPSPSPSPSLCSTDDDDSRSSCGQSEYDQLDGERIGDEVTAAESEDEKNDLSADKSGSDRSPTDDGLQTEWKFVNDRAGHSNNSSATPSEGCEDFCSLIIGIARDRTEAEYNEWMLKGWSGTT